MLDDNRVEAGDKRYESSIIRSAYSRLSPWPYGYPDKADVTSDLPNANSVILWAEIKFTVAPLACLLRALGLLPLSR